MEIIEAIRLAIGAEAVREGPADLERHMADYSVRGELPLAVVYPRSTGDVAAVMRLCHARGQIVVPQGGMTGVAGGGSPIKGCVVVSMDRMRTIEAVDPIGAVMVVQAGATLQTVQDAAATASLLFPLDMGSRGTCQIGGMAATNAGGNRVLRYGMMRELILGVEAVLADGTVISSMNKFLKNNTGYDLKQLFIGSEGTLGIITRLVLKLYPRARSACSALCSVENYDAALQLLSRARNELGGTLSAFEVMWPEYYAIGTRRSSHAPPLPAGDGLYVLLDALGSDEVEDSTRFERMMETALEDGVVADAVLARSIQDAERFWQIREATSDFPRTFWPHIAFDVSVSTAQLGAFVEAFQRDLAESWPGVEALYFGHVADSNIHIAMKTAVHEDDVEALKLFTYGKVRDWHGSISAEHGIGLEKMKYLGFTRTPEEMALMAVIKKALDPQSILNPGKVFKMSLGHERTAASTPIPATVPG